MKFRFTASGIPCIVHVTAWEPYVEAKISGPPDHCYPEEGGFGEWELLDRQGRPAPWLEQKLTDREYQRIEEEVFNQMEGR